MKALGNANTVMREKLQVVSIPSKDRMHVSLSPNGRDFHVELYSWNAATSRKMYPTSKTISFKYKFVGCKAMSSWDTYKITVPVTDISAAVIELFPAEQRTVEQDAHIALMYHSMSTARYELAAEAVAKFREDGTVKQREHHLHPVNRLSDYQLVPMLNSLDLEAYALFMDQGTGKTAVAVSTIDNIARQSSKFTKAIVIAPNATLSNWANEFEKFSSCKYRCTVVQGDMVKRMEQIILGLRPPEHGEEFGVLVMGYRTVVNMWAMLKNLKFDVAALDESHSIKGPNTQQTKACIDLARNSARRYILTGTPIEKSPADLYCQLEFMREGLSGFTSHKAFKSFYGSYVYDNDGHEVGYNGVINMPWLHDRLVRCSYRVTKAEVLPDLPAKLGEIIDIEMTAKQKKAYTQLGSQLALEIEEAEANDSVPYQLRVSNVLTKLLRLAQITSGHITWDAVFDDDGNVVREKKIERFADNPKLDKSIEIIKGLQKNSKALVWCNWTEDVLMHMERLDELGIKYVTYYGGMNNDEKEAAKWAFNNDPDVKCLIGNPKAGGVGVNFLGYNPDVPESEWIDTNCDTMIHYSQGWSSITRRQASDRPHRRGTRVPVREIDINIPATIDKEIRERATEKVAIANASIDVAQLLKEILL